MMLIFNKESFPLSLTQSQATPETASAIFLPLEDSSFTPILLGKLQFSVTLPFQGLLTVN